MSNEMKLLMALCDALGFEVEVEEEFDAVAYQNYREHRLSLILHGYDEFCVTKEKSDFTKTSYKLTKKKTETPKPIPE